MLRMTTAVPGHEATIRLVASMPFMLGMAMSMTTTSGDCSSARRTLSRPSAASATIAKSGCFSSRARSPSRTTVWSSASSMRMGILFFGDRQLSQYRCSPPRMGFDGDAATQPADALFHTEQPEASHVAGVESVAVVTDTEADPARLTTQLNLDVVRVGV